MPESYAFFSIFYIVNSENCVHLSTPKNTILIMKMLSFFLILAMLSSFRSIEKPTRIVFFGDSITQAGVEKGGYIDVFNQMLVQTKKDDQFELLGAGVSGNKVYDLYLRLEDDVLSKKPDVVVIWVGVNDVWHKRTHGTGTDADKFEKFYVAIIKKIQATGAKVIMATPAAIGERTDFSNELDGDLNHYSEIIRRVAKQNNCQIADLRAAFLDYNLKNNPQNKESGILTSDRVHLNGAGNKFVADILYKILVK